MTELIFMLTLHDVTIPNAIEVFDEIKDTNVKFVGFKNIGLPKDKMRILVNRIKEAKKTTFMEVVTYEEKEQYEAVDLATELSVDYLIGCMPQYALMVKNYIKKRKKKLNFFPYIGEIVGHPCKLTGKVEDIIQNGKKFEEKGIEGINLLLYRYNGDTNILLNKVVTSLNIPIIVAGSVDNFQKIKQLKEKNIWAFTIGGAILEKKFVNGSIKDQISAVLDFIKS